MMLNMTRPNDRTDIQFSNLLSRTLRLENYHHLQR